MLILRLSMKSIWNRRLTTLLTIFSVALSTLLILGVERIRTGARNGFQSTVSGTDLIVGARGAPIQILFYSVFGIGNPTNNISWATYEEFAHHPEVLAAVPISLGDSLHGFRVVGTSQGYFDFYKYGKQRALEFSSGDRFQHTFDAVLGADVAQKLKYEIGKQFILSHGIGEVVFQQHSGKFFTVVGILQHTGTPVDSDVFVTLDSMKELHKDLQEASSEAIHHPDEGTEISAFFLKLRSKMGIFQVQREINEYPNEAITAIVPGMALRELWSAMDIVEKALLAMSTITFAVSLTGMMMVFLSTLNERRREMAILRSVGAHPWFLSGLLLFEAGLLAAAGILTGFAVLNGILFSSSRWLQDRFGLSLTSYVPGMREFAFLILALAFALLAALVPGWRAYRNTLSDGLTVRT